MEKVKFIKLGEAINIDSLQKNYATCFLKALFFAQRRKYFTAQSVIDLTWAQNGGHYVLKPFRKDFIKYLFFFDKEKLISNYSMEIDEETGICRREMIKFNLDYLRERMDYLLNKYGFEKVKRNRLKIDDLFDTDYIICTSGGQGKLSHYQFGVQLYDEGISLRKENEKDIIIYLRKDRTRSKWYHPRQIY